MKDASMSRSTNYDFDKVLQEMQADYWHNLEKSEDESTTSGDDYLVVLSGQKSFALKAGLCKEILKLPPVVKVPRLPRHIRGIFNLRGEIVAVTDVSALLGGAATETKPRSRLVIVEHGPMKTALLVDGVEGLRRVDDEQVEALAAGTAAGKRELFKGKVMEEQGPLVLLDMERFLAQPDLLVDQQRET